MQNENCKVQNEKWGREGAVSGQLSVVGEIASLRLAMTSKSGRRLGVSGDRIYWLPGFLLAQESVMTISSSPPRMKIAAQC